MFNYRIWNRPLPVSYAQVHIMLVSWLLNRRYRFQIAAAHLSTCFMQPRKYKWQSAEKFYNFPLSVTSISLKTYCHFISAAKMVMSASMEESVLTSTHSSRHSSSHWKKLLRFIYINIFFANFFSSPCDDSKFKRGFIHRAPRNVQILFSLSNAPATGRFLAAPSKFHVAHFCDKKHVCSRTAAAVIVLRPRWP